MKFFKETEKAGMIRMILDYYMIEHEYEFDVWVPKSQIKDGHLTQWIMDAKKADKYQQRMGGAHAYFYDADHVELTSIEEVKREERFNAGCENYDRLIKLAAENEVKGVRVGLRRLTIEKKLAAAGVAF